MNADNVHGCGALFSSTILRSGRRGQYGPDGIAKLNGREGKRSAEEVTRGPGVWSPEEKEEDMTSSSSASQPPVPPVDIEDVD